MRIFPFLQDFSLRLDGALIVYGFDRGLDCREVLCKMEARPVRRRGDGPLKGLEEIQEESGF